MANEYVTIENAEKCHQHIQSHNAQLDTITTIMQRTQVGYMGARFKSTLSPLPICNDSQNGISITKIRLMALCVRPMTVRLLMLLGHCNAHMFLI